MRQRCSWVGDDALMIEYHDKEWGVPVHDDTKLFEFIILDAMQAGLSWKTVLHKRLAFEKAFALFDINKVAEYDTLKIEELLGNKGIIRNRQKIEAAVHNAKRILELKQEYLTFSDYIWQFVGNKPIKNSWSHYKDVPAISQEAEAMSADLKNRGFKFVGPTICYAFMQAAGLVNDHLTSCFRYRKV